MRYEYERPPFGDTVVVDTKEIDYTEVWRQLRLKRREITAANRVVRLFHTRESRTPELDYYLTREEIETASGNPQTVQILIDSNILSLHSKWHRPLRISEITPEGGVHVYDTHLKHKVHSQALYRLDPDMLFKLANGFYPTDTQEYW